MTAESKVLQMGRKMDAQRVAWLDLLSVESLVAWLAAKTELTSVGKSVVSTAGNLAAGSVALLVEMKVDRWVVELAEKLAALKALRKVDRRVGGTAGWSVAL